MMKRLIWSIVVGWGVVWGSAAVPVLSAGPDAVVVITNAGNPASDLSMAQLALIYQGRKSSWEDGRPIVPVNRAVDSEARRIFYQRVLRSEPTRKFFLPGSPIPLSLVVQPSALGVKRFVANAPGAIGYLLLSELGDDLEGVKVISVDGIRPNEQTAAAGSYKLQ
ncbi:MAG: substrate-binding domain-containing protein [Nitrospirota bacterium]